MHTPGLIIFEGVDGAGKSSISERLLLFFKSRNTAVRLLSFPGKVPRTLGGLVYAIHHDAPAAGIESLTPASLQALHVAAHIDAIESVIVPALEAGETVVLDRYWWSTWVYGVAGGVRADILEALIEAERRVWGKWRPALLFHVTRSGPPRGEFYDRLHLEYEALARRERENHPVLTLVNDDSLEKAVTQAIEALHGR